MGLWIYSRGNWSSQWKGREGFLEEVLSHLGPKGKVIFNEVIGTGENGIVFHPIRRNSICKAPQEKESGLWTLSFNHSIPALVCFTYWASKITFFRKNCLTAKTQMLEVQTTKWPQRALPALKILYVQTQRSGAMACMHGSGPEVRGQRWLNRPTALSGELWLMKKQCSFVWDRVGGEGFLHIVDTHIAVLGISKWVQCLKVSPEEQISICLHNL